MEPNRVEKIDNLVGIKNILISVSDKNGIEPFVLGLLKIIPGVSIFSTGGTFKKIESILGQNQIKNLHTVSSYTGQPEMQGGLVKTLDYKIYLGLLSEPYNDVHLKDLEKNGARQFDMVVANLYPFRKTINETGCSMEKARGNIDIGGPCMLRGAAKNFLRVASVCDPDDYKLILSEMEKNGGKISFATRYFLAKKAFIHTAEYDKAIARYFTETTFEDASSSYKSS